MALLYNIEGEVAIEMSSESWQIVERIVRDALLAELFPVSNKGYSVRAFNDLECFANKVRSHLQHLEAEKPTPPPSNNLDLI